MISLSDFPFDLAQIVFDARVIASKKGISVISAETALKQDGYSLSPFVHDFIKWSYGMVITRKLDPEWLVDWIEFDPAAATAGVYPVTIAEFSSKLGEHLVPVGEADCGNTTLLMDPTGKVYGYYGALVLIGENPVEAISTLYYGRNRKPVVLNK